MGVGWGFILDAPAGTASLDHVDAIRLGIGWIVDVEDGRGKEELLTIVIQRLLAGCMMNR